MDYYTRKTNASIDIKTMFFKDLENEQPINLNEYFLKITLRYGLSKKFVKEILDGLTQNTHLRFEDGVYR